MVDIVALFWLTLSCMRKAKKTGTSLRRRVKVGSLVKTKAGSAADERREPKSIRDRIEQPLSRAELWKRIEKGLSKFGYIPPKGNYELACWFSEFINAPPASLRRFEREASYLSSLRGGSALKENIADKLPAVQRDAMAVIKWSVDERAKKKGMSTAPLNPINYEVNLHRVGDKVERGFLALDFEGRIFSLLFDLLSSGRAYFWRCKQCRKIFARRGRRIYCSAKCLETARPERREWFRDYMRKRRASREKLEKEAPDLAEKVDDGRMRLAEALAEKARRVGARKSV